MKPCLMGSRQSLSYLLTLSFFSGDFFDGEAFSRSAKALWLIPLTVALDFFFRNRNFFISAPTIHFFALETISYSYSRDSAT